METNILITFVMYYSLFNKKLFDNENEFVKYFPKNVFGVFSTIRRTHTLKSWPIDIHGCIGYWDNNFNTLSTSDLYSNLLRISYDSLWTDDRKTYFKPIETDPNSIQELDFMLNPIYSINKDTGIISQLNEPFTNSKFGIIIQSKLQKATYLPNVFPNISWNDIIISIKQKAGITSDDYDLFAYKIKQIKSCFINILTDKIFSYICLFNFSRLLLDNMKIDLKYPFIYSYKNETFYWDDKDDVRNISTLIDIYKYINLYTNISTNTELYIIEQKILNILNNIKDYSSQSLSFLGYIIPIFNVNKDQFCQKLSHDLPSAEDEFEKQEIIIGLNQAGCKINEYDFVYNLDDSIFKMNWVIQAIISYNKIPSDELVNILERKINEILFNKTIETNFIAVAFESICFVYRSTHKVNLLNKIFELLFELEKRKNSNGLYTFLDNTVRIDISNHVYNGLFELKKIIKIV